MSFQEILQVKDDILKNNRLLEEKIKSHIDDYGNKFTKDINAFSDRINKVNENNHKFMELLPNINFQISKIDRIEKFDLRTEHKLASYELRITNILEQIEKIKTKYDKIILDNLYVSGHIGGAHSPYANLSEYLLVNINDVNSLKNEKEIVKKGMKNIKSKYDNIIKDTVNIVDGSVKRCNQYTDNKQKYFQMMLDTKMREFNEKIMEIRMNVCKIQMQTEEAVNNLNIGFEKLKEENKYFMENVLEKVNNIKNHFTEFKNKYDNNINILNKDNTLIKKDTHNIKENIKNLLNILEHYQNTENIENSNQDIKLAQKSLNDSIETQKKLPNLKGSYLSLMNEPKNKISLLSPTIRNTKKKFILNSVNFNAANKPGQIRRSIKKRNTVAYTEPVFDERTKNKLKEKIDKKNRINSPKFLGLLTPVLKNIINFGEEEKNDKNLLNALNNKNENKLEFYSTYKSEDKKNSNNDKSENSINQSKNNNSESKSYLKSNSITLEEAISSASEEKKDKIVDLYNSNFKMKKSNSKKNFSNLTLKGGRKKKLSTKNNTNNNINEKNNDSNKINSKNSKKNKRRSSVGIFNSVNNMYENNDISDILSKKFSTHHINKEDKNNSSIDSSKNNNEINDSINYIKHSFIEEGKKNNNENISKNHKDKDEEQLKKSNIVNISKTKLINNKNNNQNTINIKRGSGTNYSINNANNMNSLMSKNHKLNYVLTPTNDRKEMNTIGYKIVSFDLPQNINLPQKVNQIYSLNGKKLKKRPQIKTENFSPLDDLYKQQYEKKIKEMKNVSNQNDLPKKLLPIFGRTAYTFYGKNDTDGGINLTNSVDSNKNKNFNSIKTLSRNFNIPLTNNMHTNIPLNIKSFPKLKNK